MADEPDGLLDQSEIEALFGSMGAESSVSGGAVSGASLSGAAPTSDPFAAKPFQLAEIADKPDGDARLGDINLIADVELNVRVELGRTRLYIEEVLKLKEGSIVPLDKLAGDPVDIYVNGQLLARGEVLVLNDNFCIRVSEIVGERDLPGRAD